MSENRRNAPLSPLSTTEQIVTWINSVLLKGTMEWMPFTTSLAEASSELILTSDYTLVPGVTFDVEPKTSVRVSVFAQGSVGGTALGNFNYAKAKITCSPSAIAGASGEIFILDSVSATEGGDMPLSGGYVGPDDIGDPPSPTYLSIIPFSVFAVFDLVAKVRYTFNLEMAMEAGVNSYTAFDCSAFSIGTPIVTLAGSR